MSMDQRQTWDKAPLGCAVAADRRRRTRVTLIALVSLLGVGLLPAAAQGHEYGPRGVGGAQLYVSPDGYDKEYTHGFTGGIHLGVSVGGVGFKPSDVAQVFQCERGAVDLHAECQLIATAPTSLKGDLNVPHTVTLRSSFIEPAAGGNPRCRGDDSMVQCSLVAATFGPNLKPTSKAEHLICFFGPNEIHECEDRPTGPSPAPPVAGKLSMGVDGYDGYYPGDGLAPVYGLPYTPPINVDGRDFLPNDVVEMFQCQAGEIRDLRVYCNMLGTAPTGRNGKFTATVSLSLSKSPDPGLPIGLDNWHCRGSGAVQCSVIAATFDRTDPGVHYDAFPGVHVGNIRPTSQGENYICFEGPETCANKPGAPVPTTTTTTTTVVPPPEEHHVADFDGNGSTDISVFRPSDGTWYVRGGTWTQWGANGDVPVPGDYDGDGAADVAFFRPEGGLWAIRHSGGAPDLFMTYGSATDIPVVADYDGDKKADIAVFRTEDATWKVHRSSDGIDTTTFFGLSTDIPTPGYYDGDDKADVSVYRDGTWFVLPSTGGPYTSFHWGLAGDIPVPADYDADPDETTEFAVFRPSEAAWYVLGQGVLFHGLSGDVPVPGHYDADPFVDVGVFRPSTAEWFIHGQPAPVYWGIPGDIPLPLPSATYRRFF